MTHMPFKSSLLRSCVITRVVYDEGVLDRIIARKYFLIFHIFSFSFFMKLSVYYQFIIKSNSEAVDKQIDRNTT